MLPDKATIFILGSGGYAHELHDYIRQLVPTPLNTASRSFGKSYLSNDIFFVDDNNPEVLSVQKYHQKCQKLDSFYTIMGSGHCHIKLQMANEIMGDILSFIHPRAVNLGEVGKGCVLAPGAVLAPRAVLEDHVLCNYNSTVGHDSKIGSYSVICPNASVGGTCTLGEGVYVGSNACIREKINIGDGATIGMGAIVTKDVPAGATIVNVNERLK